MFACAVLVVERIFVYLFFSVLQQQTELFLLYTVLESVDTALHLQLEHNNYNRLVQIAWETSLKSDIHKNAKDMFWNPTRTHPHHDYYYSCHSSQVANVWDTPGIINRVPCSARITVLSRISLHDGDMIIICLELERYSVALYIAAGLSQTLRHKLWAVDAISCWNIRSFLNCACNKSTCSYIAMSIFSEVTVRFSSSVQMGDFVLCMSLHQQHWWISVSRKLILKTST